MLDIVTKVHRHAAGGQGNQYLEMIKNEIYRENPYQTRTPNSTAVYGVTDERSLRHLTPETFMLTPGNQIVMAILAKDTQLN